MSGQDYSKLKEQSSKTHREGGGRKLPMPFKFFLKNNGKIGNKTPDHMRGQEL